MDVSKVLLLAAIIAFIFPQPGILAKDYIIFFLSLSVLFSLLGTSEKLRFTYQAIKTGLIYSYGALTIGLLILAFFMPQDIRNGIILYAIFPPAVGTMALTSSWGGKTGEVFVFQLFSYVISLVFIPLAALFLIGSSVDPSVLLTYILLMFIAPASIKIMVKPQNKKLMTNLSLICLAFVYYITIAKSQSWVFNSQILIYSVPLVAGSFLISYIVYRSSKNPDALIYSIFKNGGAAAAASLAILPETGTAIISIKVLIDVLLVVLYGKIFKIEKKRSD